MDREAFIMIAKSLNCSEQGIKEALHYQYWELWKSMRDIAEATKVPYETIRSLMKQFKIPTRHSTRSRFKGQKKNIPTNFGKCTSKKK
jgi:hypothetical protein